ncbi:unnamed protein product, partial [Didymodactylos carnosus]
MYPDHFSYDVINDGRICQDENMKEVDCLSSPQKFLHESTSEMSESSSTVIPKPAASTKASWMRRGILTIPEYSPSVLSYLTGTPIIGFICLILSIYHSVSDLNTPCLPTDTLFHQFTRETHHHLSVNHPQQRHNNDYQTIGMKLVATYPKLESKQTRTPWRLITKALSHKWRNHVQMEKKRLKKISEQQLHTYDNVKH